MWAWDKFEQGINRVHRLNSPRDVHLWSIFCDGSIDRKLEGLTQEKGDASELVLDGRLIGEQSSEVNLPKILQVAEREFSSMLHAPNSKLVDEAILRKEWPVLRVQLADAARKWYSAPHTHLKA